MIANPLPVLTSFVCQDRLANHMHLGICQWSTEQTVPYPTQNICTVDHWLARLASINAGACIWQTQAPHDSYLVLALHRKDPDDKPFTDT